MRRRPLTLVATTLAAAAALGACDTGDGRQMDDPTEPLPATTTSTTTPPDGAEPLP